MESKLGAVLGILWVQICSGVRGVGVEQSPSDLSLHEGTSSALRCNFSTTIMIVQWFQQNRRNSLIRLFYLTPGTKENGRLKSTFNSKERYSTLNIRDAQLVDLGTYLCAVEAHELKNQVSLTSMNMFSETCSVLVLLLMLRRSNGDSVSQTEGLVAVTEGSPVMLNCTYQTTYSFSYISWYVQYPKKVPLLLLRSSTDNKRTEHQGFHATLQKSNSSFHLQKSSVQLSDSALYYCAVSDTVRETAGEAAHKSRVQEGRGEWPCEEGLVFFKWGYSVF
ncbi:hypothetical protein U0070_016253 [Myodes glareolus]|uniref:Ig-like domain-containing protein n=1 Tax=Myodes glareolus TaxID=447135 RepID=A0AAW0HDG4_MYOGA